EVGDSASAGECGIRLHAVPGVQYEAAFVGAGVGEGEGVGAAGEAGEVDEVEVEGAVAPAFVAHAPEVGFDAVQFSEELFGGEGAAHEYDGVEVCGGGVVDSVGFECGSFDDDGCRTDRDPVDAADGGDRGAQRGFPVALVA